MNTKLKDCTSEQEVITLTLTKIAAQDWKPASSVSSGTCQYRVNSDGEMLCCAVGVHIEEDVYEEIHNIIENKSVSSIAGSLKRRPVSEKAKELQEALHAHIETLVNLQCWHDETANLIYNEEGYLAGDPGDIYTSLKQGLGYLRGLFPKVKIHEPSYYEKMAKLAEKLHEKLMRKS